MCHGLWYGVDDVVDDDPSTESLLFTEAGRLHDLEVVLVPRRSVALRVRSTTNLGGLCAEGQPSKCAGGCLARVIQAARV